MLLEVLQQASNDIDTYYRAQSNRAHRQRYVAGLKKLMEQTERLSQCLTALEAISKQGIPMSVDMDPADQNALLSLLRDYDEKIDRSELTSEDIQVLTLRIDRVRDSYNARWRQTAGHMVGSLLEYLEIISYLHDDPNRVRSLKSRITRHLGQLPQHEDGAREFKTAVNEAKNIIMQLKLKDEIRDFFRKLIEERATLADLSPDVWQWIKDQRLEKRLSIGFARV